MRVRKCPKKKKTTERRRALNETTIIAIVTSLFSSGVILGVIEWLRNRKKDSAEAMLIKEQAETEDATQQRARQDIIREWEERYGDLVRRLDDEREIRDNIQRTTEGVINNLRHDLEVAKDEFNAEKKRADSQAKLLIDLRKQQDENNKLIIALSDENKRLKAQMDSMQSTIDEQASIIARLKRELIKRDAEVISLRNRYNVERAQRKILSPEDDGKIRDSSRHPPTVSR